MVSISKPCMEQFFFSVDDPIMSLILSQNSDGFSGFERGSRYNEYSRLSESKLRMKRGFQKFLHGEEPMIKKQIRPEGNTVISQEDESKKQSRLEKLTPMKNQILFELSPVKKQSLFEIPPVKKQSLFELSPIRKALLPSSLAQSVPDFSALLRKENLRPAVNTPKSRNDPVLRASVLRKSAIAGEKSGGRRRPVLGYSQFY